MAANTSTNTTLTNIGNREDLSDRIYRVAAEETPFMSNIGKATATATYHEWQTETLATPDATNAALEGNQNANNNSAPNLTTRIGNYTQIFTKVGEVSGTQQAVKSAGNSGSLARQKLLKGIELKRDMEARFIGNYASNTQSGATPRRAAGALAWLTSNVSRGATGTSGGFSGGVVAAAGPGTQRTFTETLLKAVLATGFSNGARPSQAYMGPTNKQQFSAFTGIADIRVSADGNSMASIVGAADVYVSDFGNLTLIPHPYGLTRDCLLIDPRFWAVATLRPIESEALAKTGDSDEFQIVGEATLEARNEKSSGVVADLS
jgi:hypothetical protein